MRIALPSLVFVLASALGLFVAGCQAKTEQHRIDAAYKDWKVEEKHADLADWETDRGIPYGTLPRPPSD